MLGCLHIERLKPHAFAITPQLLPASRIVFNLCSSSAVQGVFVLAFFVTGVSGGGIAALAFVAIEGPATLLSEL